MAFITIVNSRFAVNAPASTDLFSDIVSDLNYLYTNQNAPSVSGGIPNVVNPSFELDVNTTIQPTGWQYVAGTGGTGMVTTGQYNDGSQSYLVTQGTTAGNTGGYLYNPYNQSSLSQQYYVVSPSKKYTFQFMLLNNRTDIENAVGINWYTNTQSFISANTVLLQATGGANTSWESFSFNVTPPSNAYYCTLFFGLGVNGTTPPGATGNIWLDGISFSEYNPCQSGSAYTSGNNTFTVPSGIYTLKVSCYIATQTTVRGTVGATSIGFMSVIPGDVLTIDLASYTNPAGGGSYYGTFVYNQRTGSVIAAQSGTVLFTGAGPTGGYLNAAACLINLAPSSNAGIAIYPNLITLEY